MIARKKHQENKEATWPAILLFLLVTFTITWTMLGIIILANHYWDALTYGSLVYWALMLLAALGPTFASYFLYRWINGKKGMTSYRIFLKTRKLSRLSFVFLLLYSLWRFAMIYFGFGLKSLEFFPYLLLNFPLYVLDGGLEELGWRAYLQPALEKRTSTIFSTILVGLIWAVWHLPLWFIEGTGQSGVHYGLYVGLCFILSFSFTAFFKLTKNIGSLVFSHAWLNACLSMAFTFNDNGQLVLLITDKVMFFFGLEFVVALLYLLLSQTFRKSHANQRS